MKFERISTAPDAILPVRATSGAAGYDFCTYGQTTIPPHTIALIPTGIKCQIDDGYYLQLALRSSTPKKKGLMLANSVGIIDQDYYNNSQNEGAIMFQVYNFTDNLVIIENGERIGQGIFMKYFKTDDDVASGIRTGGFGSTSDENLTKAQENNIRDVVFEQLFDLFSGQNISSEEEDSNTGDFQND